MNSRANNRGFTLIELMIVIAIIGILAGMAVPNFQRARNQAREKKCWEGTSTLARFAEQYNIDNRGYPGNIDDLKPYFGQGTFARCPTGAPYAFFPTTLTEMVDVQVRCPVHGSAFTGSATVTQ